MTAKRDGRAGLRAPLWLGVLSVLGFGLGVRLAGEGLAFLLAGAALAGVSGVLIGLGLRQRASHPLRTAANVLDALRRGDYTHRARTDQRLNTINADADSTRERGHIQ